MIDLYTEHFYLDHEDQCIHSSSLQTLAGYDYVDWS